MAITRGLWLVMAAAVPIAASAQVMPSPQSARVAGDTVGDTVSQRLAPGRLVPAPPPPPSDRPESVTVVPGPEYRASGIRALFAGKHYRDLWTTSVRVPVLDLARFAGGLTPIKHGGGSQTVSLHFMGANGIEYAARSVDKRPYVPEDLRGSIVESVVRDETSASMPTAALVVAPLVEAAGLPHIPQPTLVVIPDDPRLGKYRREFAGMLAELEARPRTSDGEDLFADASKVETTDKLLARMQADAGTRIDARQYLTARLLDIYVGDWDRGASQWRWVRTGGKDDRVWRPVALDRDWAFQRADGLLSALLRADRPELVVFDDHYPAIISVTFQSWALDRRLLQGVDGAAWDSTAAALVRALTDSVIRSAVDQMPPEERARRGAQLETALRHRRDGLEAMARRFYLEMAHGADVHSTAEPTVAEVTGHEDTLDVRLRLVGGDVYYDRRFVGDDTKEIRLYLDGPGDSVIVRGGDAGIRARIIGDSDVVVDSSRVTVDRYNRQWSVHPPPPGASPARFNRDDGSSCSLAPGLAGSSDIGFVVGVSAVCTKYGFRQEPFAFRQSLLLGYATLPGGGVADYLVQYRPTQSQTVWSLRATGVSAQFTQFFGYGNGTSIDVRDPISQEVNPRSLDFFQVRESRAALYPAVTIPLADHLTWTVGPQLRYWDADHTPGTTNYIAMTQPYGVGAFGTLSALTSLRYDTRDAVALPTRGLLIDVTGRAVPGVWSADSEGAYGSVRGQATTYLTSNAVPLTPTLALRAGGMKVWGDAPYQDLAHIGSRGGIDDPFTVRGFYPDRFTGTAAAWGTAQLSAVLFHPKILLPSNVGIFLLNDVGRVFYPAVGGASSAAWHDGYGGGFFVSTLHNAFSFSAGAAHSSEWTLLYFGVGTGL